MFQDVPGKRFPSHQGSASPEAVVFGLVTRIGSTKLSVGKLIRFGQDQKTSCRNIIWLCWDMPVHSRKLLRFPYHVFMEDVDRSCKLHKNLLDGSQSCIGARLFHFDVSRCLVSQFQTKDDYKIGNISDAI